MQKRRKTPLEKIEFEADSCSTDSRLKILHELPFFNNLAHDAIDDINAIFRDHHYPAGETIYFCGDKSTQLCVIDAGSVKLVKHSFEGQDV
jgi:CRP-like cAMP-binding protein